MNTSISSTIRHEQVCSNPLTARLFQDWCWWTSLSAGPWCGERLDRGGDVRSLCSQLRRETFLLLFLGLCLFCEFLFMWPVCFVIVILPISFVVCQCGLFLLSWHHSWPPDRLTDLYLEQIMNRSMDALQIGVFISAVIKHTASCWTVRTLKILHTQFSLTTWFNHLAHTHTHKCTPLHLTVWGSEEDLVVLSGNLFNSSSSSSHSKWNQSACTGRAWCLSGLIWCVCVCLCLLAGGWRSVLSHQPLHSVTPPHTQHTGCFYGISLAGPLGSKQPA